MLELRSKLAYYAGIMLNALGYLLCRYNRPKATPNGYTSRFYTVSKELSGKLYNKLMLASGGSKHA